MELTTHYFEKAGEENTDILLSLVKKRAFERDITNIIVASTRGNTGVKAAKIF